MKKLAFIVAAALFAFASPAAAHAHLESSLPKNGAMLMGSPKLLELTFDSSVRLLKLGMTNRNGDEINIGFKPSPKESTKFTMNMPKLVPGTYEVKWVLLGADTHTVPGALSFMVH